MAATLPARDKAGHQVAHGSQVILDLYECETSHLDDLPWVEATLVEAARVAGATIVQTVFHKFAPWGISGVVVISESHLAIHIWPENRYAAVDIFTCGESVRIEVASAFLKRAFRAGRAVRRSFKRGDRAGAAHRRDLGAKCSGGEVRASSAGS
jgi:S-adenosylmethionine decarboxylase proenzyme